MGRKRTNVFIQKPDRIKPDDLAHWMRVNDISINKLATALSSVMGFGSTKYRTVEGWLKSYRPAPAWLEHRINFVASQPGAKLPRYGQRWEVAATPLEIAPPPLDTPKAQTCAECGGPLDSDGDRCLWEFCPTNDGDPDD